MKIMTFLAGPRVNISPPSAPSFPSYFKIAHGFLQSRLLQFAVFVRQKAPWHKPGVRNRGRNHSAADHGGGQMRVLPLVDDAMVQSEQRGNRPEGKARGHH